MDVVLGHWGNFQIWHSLAWPRLIFTSNLKLGLCPGEIGSGLRKNHFVYHSTQICVPNHLAEYLLMHKNMDD